MLSALVLGQLLCGAVLITSAVAKFRAPRATADAVVALRLPKLARSPILGTILPVIELALGLGLVFLAGVPLQMVAFATTLLFVGYTVLVGRALGFDDPVDCACFGELGEPELTPRSLVRNIALVVAAGCAVVGAAYGISIWVLTPPEWLWIAMAGLCVAFVQLVAARPGRTTPANSGPGGAISGLLKLLDPQTGNQIRLDSGPRPWLLIFVSPSCVACRRVQEKLPTWRGAAQGLTITLVYPSDTDPTLVDANALIDPGGNIAVGLAGGTTPVALLWNAASDCEAPILGYDAIEEFVVGFGGRGSADPAGFPVLDYVRRPIPDAVVLVDGTQPKTLLELAARQAQLLVSLASLDSAAEGMLAQLAGWQQRLPQLRVAVLSSVPAKDFALELPVPVYFDYQGRARIALGIKSNSSGVLLGADGGLAGGPVPAVELPGFVTDIETELTSHD